MTGVLDGSPDSHRRGSRGDGLPPHDTAAEEAIIAAVLLDDDAFPAVEPIVATADFFREENAWTFDACAALWRRGERVTIPTVAHELDRRGQLDGIGGERYLAEIAGKYFTAVGVEAHARIVARDATYRRLIQAAGQIAQAAYEGGPDVSRVLALGERLLAIAEAGEAGGVLTSIDRVRALAADNPDQRVTTGFRSLDSVLGGFRAGQITVVGGRTDTSKTAFCIGSAVNIAARAGVLVAYIPLEDSAREVSRRMVDHVAGVSHSGIRRQSLTHAARLDALDTWAAADDFVRRLPIWMPEDGKEPFSMESVERTVARAAAEGAGVVFVDHIDALDLSSSREGRGQSDAAVVAAWMRCFKRLALRHGLHIVIASQVSRAGSARDEDDLVPPMATLKESGAKEQLAQNVIMIGLEAQPTFAPNLPHRALFAYVEKLKGFEGETRWVVDNPSAPPEGQRPALFLARHAGAVYEHGVPPIDFLPQQAALVLAALEGGA